MKRLKWIHSPVLILTLAIELALRPSVVLAVQAPSELAKGVKASVDCPDFCQQFADGKGLVSSSTWNENDDILCNELGAATASGNLKTRSEIAPGHADCVVPITTKVLPYLSSAAPAEACAQAGKMRDHCKFHNSPVESQCMAYNAISGFKGPNGQGALNSAIFLLTLDMAAVSLCAAECAIATSGMMYVCGGVAAAAGAAETIRVLAMKSNKIQDYISLAGGSLGFVGGVTGMFVNSQLEGTHATEEADAKTRRGIACSTAVAFAALAGVRTYDIAMMSKAKEETCKKINNLFSDAVPASTGNSSSGGSTGGSSSTGGGGNGGGVAPAGGSSTTATLKQLQSLADCSARTNNSNLAACLDQAGIKGASSGMATDADLLSKLGPSDRLFENLPQMHAMATKAMKEGAGPALASMMGGSLGEAGDAIAAMAKISQDEGSKLIDAVPLSTYASSGGVSRSPSSSAAKADNPFASLFGNQPGAGPAGGTDSAQFGSPKIVDIWHSNTTQNLFEIVSEKITRVSNRIQ